MTWMIYGANGYTGELSAREAVRKGLGVMPPFADKLTPEQIDAVAEFVAKAAQ